MGADTASTTEQEQVEGPLVSVIIPCYNGADHVRETLGSALAQTFGDLEAIVVDDCSTDDSVAVIRGVAASDPRVQLHVQQVNQGVAKARNLALSKARGRYIAYLDSGDLWMPEKLERQLAFMQRNGYGACFTSYENVEEDGTLHNVVHVPQELNYGHLLKNTVTCSHTVMFDTEIVDKSLLVMPDLRRGQDFATWLQVAKAGHVFHGFDEALAKYRKSSGSLSSNKLTAAKRTWNVYRNVEHLSVLCSAWCLCWHFAYAMAKRVGRNKI